MALIIKNQKVYISKIEKLTRDTKEGKRKFTKGSVSFLSSVKNEKGEYISDDVFFVNYVSFSKDVNILINETIIKKGLQGKTLEVTGKIVTRSHDNKTTGKKEYFNEFIIFSANEVAKTTLKNAETQPEEILEEIPF